MSTRHVAGVVLWVLFLGYSGVANAAGGSSATAGPSLDPSNPGNPQNCAYYSQLARAILEARQKGVPKGAVIAKIQSSTQDAKYRKMFLNIVENAYADNAKDIPPAIFETINDKMCHVALNK